MQGLRVLSPVIVLALTFSVGGMLVALDRAEGCPAATEQARQAQAQTRSPLAPSLPDCRAYEQVSPADKNGVDASGEPGLVQTSLAGEGITYFAVAPFPGTVGSAQLPSYLSTRALSDAWSTQGIEALIEPDSVEIVVGVTEDLNKTIILVGGQPTAPPCEPESKVCGGSLLDNAYVRDNATGSLQLLAKLGSNPLVFVGATHDGSRIFFETEALLTPEANAGSNLYEWNQARPPAERVTLVGVLPDSACGSPPCAPSEGSAAGPGGPAVSRTPFFYTQNAVSREGSRVFFSDIKEGVIYMREPDTKETIQVSAGREAYWRAATPDGDWVFYTEGPELYRFNVLTETREQLTTGAEGVLGVLGISESDGSYVYFTALGGELASNENANHEKAVTGDVNLYAWHEGRLTFIARLVKPGFGEPGDEANWRGASKVETESGGPSGGEKSSRLSTDGRYLLFASTAKLTRYNNDGRNEFYLYDGSQSPSSTNPVCVSCNLAGTPAIATARLTNSNRSLTAAPLSRNPFLTHNLSSDGHRVFFETEEALVSGDANLQRDVYEWEADGEGSCKSEAQNGGCLYLISTGQNTQASYFGDASIDGSEVFFFTRQSLVSQDQDNNADLYDARIEGGIPSQNLSPTQALCAEEAKCRGASSNTPSTFGAPMSTTFSGSGNLASSASAKALVKTAAQIRAEKLAKALKACKSKPRSKRKRCEVTARKRYGTSTRKAKRSTIRGGRHQ